MPLTESTADRLTALAQVSISLASCCEAAKTGADSDDPRTDPLMGTVRKMFLAVQSLGVEVSRISSNRPATLRANAGDLFEDIGLTMPSDLSPQDEISLRQFQTAVNEVSPSTSFEQIQSCLLYTSPSPRD